ncbi:hypothetical protein AKJ65_01135 [candidate division MSBL1 archaeon SCGC-AAA259E19]|uniref:Uncharacterized protein n=1 Tax=candidate division MSBL1 archaeon SCGC-AAA259E19 TaxID=1698264 RepID=A0A133UN98_9EURY|nr:hypothetical protein AKJ65_01135 [candidate division MSBL1 archaeon SCGC-AAA259E19]
MDYLTYVFSSLVLNGTLKLLGEFFLEIGRESLIMSKSVLEELGEYPIRGMTNRDIHSRIHVFV